MLSRVLTLCDPVDRNLPGSSVHGILQARILEWVGLHALLQGIFLIQRSNLHLLCLLHWQLGSLSLEPLGKPLDLVGDWYSSYVDVLWSSRNRGSEKAGCFLVESVWPVKDPGAVGAVS